MLDTAGFGIQDPVLFHPRDQGPGIRDPDPGWSNSRPDPGETIPDPQHWIHKRCLQGYNHHGFRKE